MLSDPLLSQHSLLLKNLFQVLLVLFRVLVDLLSLDRLVEAFDVLQPFISSLLFLAARFLLRSPPEFSDTGTSSARSSAWTQHEICSRASFDGLRLVPRQPFLNSEEILPKLG